MERKHVNDSTRTASSHLLRQAAQRGDLLKIAARLEAGDALEGRHKGTGRTALLEAVIAGQDPSVSLLLQRGADVHACCTAVGHTALEWAVVQGHGPIAQALLAQGASPDRTGPQSFLGHTSLMLAASLGNTDLVRLLLDAGADPAVCDHRGGNALAHAESRGHAQAAAMLRAAGAMPAPSSPATVALAWPALRWEPASLTCASAPLPGDAAPQEIVRSYIVASHAWEVAAWARSEAARSAARSEAGGGAGAAVEAPAFSWGEVAARAEEIRALHCTSRKRQYPRAGIGATPAFTPQIALIEVAQPQAARAELLLRYLAPGHFVQEYETVFVCLRKKGLWRIDSAKTRLLGTSDWDSVIL